MYSTLSLTHIVEGCRAFMRFMNLSEHHMSYQIYNYMYAWPKTKSKLIHGYHSWKYTPYSYYLFCLIIPVIPFVSHTHACMHMRTHTHTHSMYKKLSSITFQLNVAQYHVTDLVNTLTSSCFGKPWVFSLENTSLPFTVTSKEAVKVQNMN